MCPARREEREKRLKKTPANCPVFRDFSLIFRIFPGFSPEFPHFAPRKDAGRKGGKQGAFPSISRKNGEIGAFPGKETMV